jgi:hypothetical protein
MSDYTGFSIDEIVQDLEYEDRYQRECKWNQRIEEGGMCRAEKNQIERKYQSAFGRRYEAARFGKNWIVVEYVPPVYVPVYDQYTGLEL